jgi:hypothetical protein
VELGKEQGRGNQLLLWMGWGTGSPPLQEAWSGADLVLRVKLLRDLGIAARLESHL